MTLREKYVALLADLVEEREKFGERWVCYYDGKIAELNATIEEKFGEENVCNSCKGTGQYDVGDCEDGVVEICPECDGTGGYDEDN